MAMTDRPGDNTLRHVATWMETEAVELEQKQLAEQKKIAEANGGQGPMGAPYPYDNRIGQLRSAAGVLRQEVALSHTKRKRH